MFGCIAYVHDHDEKISKLNPKAEKCIFIGYFLKQKRYKCFNLFTQKLQVSKDVVFDEMVNWYSPLKYTCYNLKKFSQVWFDNIYIFKKKNYKIPTKMCKGSQFNN